MAINSNFQQCAGLEVKEEFKNNDQDTLGVLMNLQKSIQEKVYGYDFEKIRSSIKDLKNFIDWNEEAIRDEDREFQAALTGIHTFPNCWKPWKSNHEKAMNRSLSDLTEEELLELQYEWIDKLHFMFNIAISIGLDSEKIFNLYHAKNRENIKRQEQGNY